ncbi:MAG: hypothetical protein JWQ85_2949 [Mucilaginibacter sp.]|nr:hypothetical protein [Mucilaginibacter sp.]
MIKWIYEFFYCNHLPCEVRSDLPIGNHPYRHAEFISAFLMIGVR